MNPSPARKPPEPAAAQHAEVDAELVRLGPRQHLVDGERLRELLVVEPAELVDALAPDHRDLRRRPAPREQAEAQEPQEDVAGRLAHRSERRPNPTDVCDPALAGHLRRAMPAPQRVVLFRPRTVLQVVGVLLGVAVALWVVWVSIRVLTWVFVALFLALALEPGVRFLQLHGMKRRGAAAAVIYLAAIGFLALLAALLVPPLVDEVDGLADAAPGYVEDITAGRGPLGFLQTDYQIVDRIREATESNGGSILGGGAGTRARHRPRRGHRRSSASSRSSS